MSESALHRLAALLALAGGSESAHGGQDVGLARVEGVPLQPVAAQARRALRALEAIGQPQLAAAELAQLDRVLAEADEAAALRTLQEVLDRRCLLGVTINPESRVKAARGPAEPTLVEQGWRAFLVKVVNEGGVTAPLQVDSPQAKEVFRQEDGPEPPVRISAGDVRDRWCGLELYEQPPLERALSGLRLEYRILQVYSRDAGEREATLAFQVGAGTADLGFRNQVSVLFRAEASVDLRLRVLDETGAPTTASFVFRDARGRVYPLPSKRLAPDFFFHDQIYRADGEAVRLPAGSYRVRCARGPEYLVQEREISIAPGDREPQATFRLERWVHPAALGWYSGDHHVHAAGCAHYTDPTRGVGPQDMLRHVVGEDLNVGCVLSWGPCWYHQKTFFEGRVSELSTPAHLMRYDVEVSGFPSSYAGHLCLLGLKEDDYPGTRRIEEWPSFDLPILLWGKSQGAVVGFSHSGFGLETKDKAVPSFEIPRFDNIGANEYIVDVTHDAVDFISAGDTPWPFELSIWYHTNNAGFRTRLSGETDFPCISGERVGMGRVYARLDGPLDFEAWLAAVKAGHSYVSEGRAHLLDFQVEGRDAGGQVDLAGPGRVRATVRAAALLRPEPDPSFRGKPLDVEPWWNVERARVEGTRRVPVEVIVNGSAVARAEVEADGRVEPLQFDLALERSSWIACRILASAHTNPVYVLVGGRPVRSSRRSVRWCLDAVEQCWRSKSSSPDLKPAERPACERAYEHARATYRRLLSECEAE
jgi:hypothetical protein